MPNEENLKPNSERTPKEREELARKAGKKSGEVRRERKLLRDELLLLLSTGNTQEKISLALIQKAIKGDTKAFEIIRDTIGEKPTDKQIIEGIDAGVNVIVNREAVQIESNN